MTWGYDETYRLTFEEIVDTFGTRTVEYVYDAVGNRDAKIDSIDGTTGYGYDANDRLTEASRGGITTTFGYDDNGNQTSKTVGTELTELEYDARNLPTEVSHGTQLYSYEYDVDGARSAKVVDGVRTNFLVDRNRPYDQVLRESDAGGAELAHHVFGRDEVLSSVRPTEGSRYMLHDAQHSVRHLTATDESISDEYDFDAWGNVLAASGASANEYRYSGERLDDETGTIYLRARQYGPDLGRFSTVDPRPGIISDPSTQHRYAYARGDAVNARDPSGEVTLTEVAVVTGIVGVGVGIATPSYVGTPVREGGDETLGYRIGECLEDRGGELATIIVSIAFGIDYLGVPIPKAPEELSRLGGNVSDKTTRLSRFNAHFNDWLRREIAPKASKIRIFRSTGRALSVLRWITTPSATFIGGYFVGLVPGCYIAASYETGEFPE